MQGFIAKYKDINLNDINSAFNVIIVILLLILLNPSLTDVVKWILIQALKYFDLVNQF